jgi:hypothetical protein
MHIAIWIFVALALGLWSLLAWGVATLLGLDPSWVGDLRAHVDKMPFAGLLDVWMPGWQALAVGLIEATQALLQWVGRGASFVVWLVWGAGALLVLGCGALLSLIVKLVAKVPDPAAERAAQAAGSGHAARP